MANKIGNSKRRLRRPVLDALNVKVARRFWTRLCQTGECLVFTGTKNQRGYGVVDVMTDGVRTPILTHRLAWVLHYGADPDPNLMVLHRCNNPSCCNIEHLYLGTALDNADDAKRAGRFRSAMKGVKGVAHPAAQYTKAQRDEVIAMLNQSIADGYGLNFLYAFRQIGIHRNTIARWWRERQKP